MQLAPITVGALTFNGNDRRFIVTGFGNFRAVAKPRSELVPAGGAAGAVAIGPWDDSEAYYTLSGSIRAPQADLLTYRGQLLDALPATTDSPVVVTDYDGVDRAVYVRRYDAPDIAFSGDEMKFSFPLVGLDPLKYGVSPTLTGTMGVFTGDEWYMTFTYDAAPTPDDAYLAFTLDTAPTPDDAYHLFQQVVATGPFPPAAVLFSMGDAISRRLTITVTGPLTQGDWKLINETTGDEIYADIELIPGQSIVFDCYRQTATMDGSSVDNLVFGDWLTLQPGNNTYRLVTGEQTEGFADIEALPAYR